MVVRLVVLVIVLGFPIALVLAWAYEGDSRRASARRRGRRRRVPLEKSHLDLIVVVAGALSAGLFFLGRYQVAIAALNRLSLHDFDLGPIGLPTREVDLKSAIGKEIALRRRRAWAAPRRKLSRAPQSSRKACTV